MSDMLGLALNSKIHFFDNQDMANMNQRGEICKRGKTKAATVFYEIDDKHRFEKN